MPRLIFSRAARIVVLTSALAAAFLVPSSRAEQAKPVEVGQIAPDFTLPDPDGAGHTASALRGEKNLLLVFCRGAW